MSRPLGLRQGRDHQRPIEPLLPGRRLVQSQARQALRLGRLKPLPPSLPYQRRQMPRRTLNVLQELQSRDQALLDIREIAAERKRWEQSCLTRRPQRVRNPLRIVFAISAGDLMRYGVSLMNA